MYALYKEAHVPVQGSSSVQAQLRYSLFFPQGVANAHANRQKGVREGLPMPSKMPNGVYKSPNIYVLTLKAFSEIAN